MKPKVLLETTIPSLLTAWPSRDLIIAADQQVTRTWWENQRGNYDLMVSTLLTVCCENLLMKNPFLEEIWAVRQRIAQRNGYNLLRTVEYLRALEADYPGRVVCFKPRRPDAAWFKPLPRVRPASHRAPSEPAATLREGSPPYGGKARGTKR